MVRLYVLVEGQTEQTFADTVLRPHLAQFEVYLNSPILIENSRRRGTRGGATRYAPIRRHVLRVTGDKSPDACFTTMLDLYALPKGFPGAREAAKHKRRPLDRVRTLEEAFAQDIGDRRFVPYLQLHEFESLLFSDPSQFSVVYPHHGRQIEELQVIADAVESPELIDDGRETAPSKRIIRAFPDYTARKPVFGPQIAASIGIDALRGKCPHFNEWVQKLENLQPVPATKQ